MTAAVRNLFSDLVDRRLWPVAVVLVAAAIAIPVLLLKPAAKTPPPRPVADSAPALGSPAVNLTSPGGGPVVGGVKNPFRQQYLPKAPSSSSASASKLGPSSSSSSSGGTSGTSGTSTGGTGGGSGGGGSHRSSGSTQSSGSVLQVRFGLADRSRKTYQVTAGSPLPTPTNPLLVYLGQDRTGKVGSFLVSSDAQPQGDGRCSPDRSICSTLYMKVGDTEFFDVTGPAGTV